MKTSRFAVLLLLTLATVLPCPAEDETEDRRAALTWKPQYTDHVWQVPGGIALVRRYAFNRAEPALVIEAEEASAFLFHSPGEVQKADGASGGQCASNPKRVELFIEFPELANLYAWYRVRLKDPAGVRFLQGIDASFGGSVGWVELKAEPGKWTWVKWANPWKFPKGLRELQMEGLPPGVDLDAIALAQDEKWQPPEGDFSPLVRHVAPAEDGNAVTDDMLPAEVVKWLRVEPERMDKRGGGCRLEMSLDRGKRWRAVPADGNLSELVTRTDGTDTIRFRASLWRQQGESPLVGPLTLAFRAPKKDTLAFEDAKSRYLFARKTGALAGLHNLGTGTNLLPPNQLSPLFWLRTKKPGFCPDDAWTDLTSFDAKCLETGIEEKPAAGGSRQLRFKYRLERGGGGIDVTVTATLKKPGECDWRATVVNQLKDEDIGEIAVPILDGVRTTERAEEDSVLHYGMYLFKAPCRVGRFLYWWPLAGVPMDDLSGPKEGVTLVSHDPTYRMTGLSCQGLGERGVKLSLHKVVDLKPGQSFTTEPNLVRVHEGDWRQACLLERPMCAELYKLSKPSVAIQEMDGWQTFGWPVPRWDQFGAFGRAQRAQYGFPLLGMWNFQVPGTCWTVPNPNPIMGNAEDLRWAIGEFRKSGMRIVYYIQSYLCDRTTEGTRPEDRIGFLARKHLWPGWELPLKGYTEKARSRKSNGEGYLYGNNTTGMEEPMCHANSAFQKFKHHWAVEMFGKRLGMDGIYWDSDSHAEPSWNTCDTQGNDPGLNGRGAYECHQKMLADLARFRPGALFAGEGPPSAVMGQVRCIHLANASTIYPMRMLFPQMILMPGGANGQDMDMEKAFLCGARLFGERVNVPHAAIQKSFLWMRKRVGQYLYPADYRDDLGLEVTSPNVEAKLFICDPKRAQGAILTIRNKNQEKDAKIRLDASEFGPVRKGWLVSSEKQDQPVEIPAPTDGKGRYEIPVPPAEASHVLLFKDAEPRVTAELDGELAAGGSATVKVRVESLTGETVRGKIELPVPKELSASPVDFEVSDGGEGKGKEVALKLTASLKATADIVDLPVTVRIQGQEPFQRPLAFYVHDPVDVRLDRCAPDQLRVRLVNRVDQPCDGRLELKAGEGTVKLAKGDIAAKFRLEPRQQVDLLYDLDGAAAAQAPWRIKGTAKCSFGKVTRDIAVYRQFWPSFPNGSLELGRFRENVPAKEYYVHSKEPDKMHTFQRNLPDYWWGLISDRSPRLDGKNDLQVEETIPAADGKRCLRLPPGKTTMCYVALNLDAQTRYRFSASIRASKPDANCSAKIIWPDAGTTGNSLALKSDMAADTWHRVESEFVAPKDGASLYLYSGKESTVWFDQFQLVPLTAPGEAEKKP